MRSNVDACDRHSVTPQGTANGPTRHIKPHTLTQTRSRGTSQQKELEKKKSRNRLCEGRYSHCEW